MKIWVLTREVNEYNQDGEYFVAAFSKLPSTKDLVSNGVHENDVAHVLNGGGRILWESEWFFLREVEI